MDTNFSILFYAKKTKTTVEGLVPIYLLCNKYITFVSWKLISV